MSYDEEDDIKCQNPHYGDIAKSDDIALPGNRESAATTRRLQEEEYKN